MKFRSAGFTLIELLVVIAVIGILAAVVLASLNTARAKGYNVTIKSDLVAIRSQAAIYYEQNAGSYGPLSTCLVNSNGTTGGACTGNLSADPIIQSQLLAIAKINSSGNARLNVAISPSRYAAYAYLKVPDSGFAVWCVDSTGASTGVATHWNNSATVCP